MALIKCSECGKEISDKASSCPCCGVPISINEVTASPEKTNVKQKKRIKKAYIILGSFLFFIILMIFIKTLFLNPDKEDSVFYMLNSMTQEDVLEKWGEPDEMEDKEDIIDYYYDAVKFLKVEGAMQIRYYTSGEIIFARWIINGTNYDNKDKYLSDIEKISSFFNQIYNEKEEREDGDITWKHTYTEERVFLHKRSKEYEYEFRPW